MPSRRRRKQMIAVALVALATVAALLLANGSHVAAAIRLVLEFERLGRNEQGCSEYQHRKTGLVMVFVPGGSVLMGSRGDDPDARPNELPQHEVRVDPFLISKYEVSDAVWQKLMGTATSAIPSEGLPVTQVSWEDCRRFSEEARLRLPTEAEWEYAARALTTTPYCFGDSIPAGAAGVDTGQPAPEPVASGRPNAFGLHQMHGNVAEWCMGSYDFEFYSRPEASCRNPISNGSSEWRVVRGGSFLSEMADTRSAFRARFSSADSHPTVGFRPVVSYFRERTP